MNSHRAKPELIIFCCLAMMSEALSEEKQNPQRNSVSSQNQPVEIAVSKIKNISAMLVRDELSTAAKLIKAHLARYPDDPDYLILLARVKQRSGELLKAIELLRLARTHAKSYEDIYLLEAGLLQRLDNSKSCHALSSLYEDYKLHTKQLQLQKFENILFARKYGVNEIMLDGQYDKLSNNRGVWRAYSILNKHTTCGGKSIYAGINTIERYNIHDTEGIVGGAVQAGNLSVELEYRQSQQSELLAKQAWSGILSLDTGLSANLMLLASGKKYEQVETDRAGLGIDYYFSDFQLTLISDKTNYYRNNVRLDSSTTQSYSLAYYFDKRKLVRGAYIAGNELENDGSANPPYSKIKTVLLSYFHPISHKTGIQLELKRHHQSGYYEQNGIRVAFNYKYQ